MAGCVAAMGGDQQISREQFSVATDLFLSMRSPWLATLILEEWARLDDPELITSGDLSARVRSGELSYEQVLARLRTISSLPKAMVYHWVENPCQSMA